MSIYPYDFQTCGHPLVDQVRAVIDAQPEWDFSTTAKEARTNCAQARRHFGVRRPRSAEQKALDKYLISQRAGLHIATYAWGTYVDLKASQTADELVPG